MRGRTLERWKYTKYVAMEREKSMGVLEYGGTGGSTNYCYWWVYVGNYMVYLSHFNKQFALV